MSEAMEDVWMNMWSIYETLTSRLWPLAQGPLRLLSCFRCLWVISSSTRHFQLWNLNKWVYLNNLWSDEQKHIHYLKKSNFSRILNAECVYIVQWEWPDSGSAAGVIKMLLVTLVSAGNIIISLSAWLCTIYFCAVTKYRPPRSHSSLHQQTTFQGTTLFLSWWL